MDGQLCQSSSFSQINNVKFYHNDIIKTKIESDDFQYCFSKQTETIAQDSFKIQAANHGVS